MLNKTFKGRKQNKWRKVNFSFWEKVISTLKYFMSKCRISLTLLKNLKKSTKERLFRISRYNPEISPRQIFQSLLIDLGQTKIGNNIQNLKHKIL